MEDHPVAVSINAGSDATSHKLEDDRSKHAKNSRKNSKDELSLSKVLESESLYEAASKLFTYAKSQAKEILYGLIPPNLQAMPHPYNLYGGITTLAIGLAFLIYFIYSNYNADVSATFISLNQNAGSCPGVSANQCCEVASPLSDTYLATNNGIWSGQSGFVYNLAIYSLTLYDYANTPANYTQLMNGFLYGNSYLSSSNQQSLSSFAAMSTQQNLAYNLLIWMGYTGFQNQGGVNYQLFQFTGDPAIIYNPSFVFGSIGSSYGLCNATSAASFNPASATFSLSYDVASFNNDRSCNNNVISVSSAEGVETDAPSFTMNLDTRSLSIAMAINLGYLSSSYLESVGTGVPVIYKGVNYTFVPTISPRYPSMQPVTCIYPGAGPLGRCILSLGTDFYGIPVFNSGGESYSQPIPCQCRENYAQPDSCNSFNFITGLITYDNSMSGTGPMLDLLFSMSAMDLNEMAYNATYITALSSLTHVASSGLGLAPEYSSVEYVQKSFEFCGEFCTIIAFSSYSSATSIQGGQLYSVSDYYYQVPVAACNDTFTIESEYWENLISSPPEDLIQDYYQCTTKRVSAIISAVGVAQGNASFLIPFVSLFLIPLIYFHMKVSGFNIPEADEFSVEEKNEVLSDLAYLLLRAERNKKHGVKAGSELDKVIRQLLHAIKVTKKEVDSDDDSDSDDSDGDKSSVRDDQSESINSPFHTGDGKTKTASKTKAGVRGVEMQTRDTSNSSL
jgi:hypothetical protein